MTFQFATCDRRRALEFLQKCYPGRDVEDAGKTSELLDLVEADIIRVQDPAMHPNTQISPSTNWDEDRRDEIVLICQGFHAEVTNAGEASDG